MSSKVFLCTFGLGFGFAATALAQSEPPAEQAAGVPRPAESSAPVPAPELVSTSNTAPGKVVLGLRLGYGVAMGAGSKDADGSSNAMSEAVSGQIPIWLDLGYMVTQNVMLGLYGQYGFGTLSGELKDSCDAASSQGVSCSASDLRVGIQAQYHILPTESINPWLGLGFGYEWLSYKMSNSGQEVSVTGKGFEFVNIQAGADFKVLPILGVGPFLSFSLGQYDSYNVEGTSSTRSGDIEHKAVHEWLTFGVRGAFKL